MSDEQTTEESWREVGEQFKTLGESLANAFRAAWESEETRHHLESIRSGLKAMVDQVDEAIKEASTSPEGEKVRQEMEKAAESARAASEKALDEARPRILSAMRQVNAELQGWIRRMEEGREGVEESAET